MRSLRSSAPASPAGRDEMDWKRLVNEGPAVIGMITSVIQSGGSIDTAIRSMSEDGPVNSKMLFSKAIRLVDTKGSKTLTEGLDSVLAQVPREGDGYPRAVLMAVSASESSDDQTRERMLRDAADIALESVRTMGESYGASLMVPCTVIFGIGIIVPMILMSILPLLNIGGMFGSFAVDQRVVVLVTLVLVPSAILMVSLQVRRDNPFVSSPEGKRNLRCAAPLLLSIPLALVFADIGGNDGEVFLYSLAPACVATLLLMSDIVHKEKGRRAHEQSLMDCIFDLGNRMISGSNFETASVDAMASRKECATVSESLSREYDLSRGDVGSAISRTVNPISEEMSLTLRNIHMCSTKDADDAGRLAITLGKQFQNRRETMKSLELKLKSATDMMVGTAMFFAPMVLGMSVSMLEPLSRIKGFVSMDGTSLILAVYLIELCALISLLVSSLRSREGLEDLVWRFCFMCPVSLLVFSVCCSF